MWTLRAADGPADGSGHGARSHRTRWASRRTPSARGPARAAQPAAMRAAASRPQPPHLSPRSSGADRRDQTGAQPGVGSVSDSAHVGSEDRAERRHGAAHGVASAGVSSASGTTWPAARMSAASSAGGVNSRPAALTASPQLRRAPPQAPTASAFAALRRLSILCRRMSRIANISSTGTGPETGFHPDHSINKTVAIDTPTTNTKWRSE